MKKIFNLILCFFLFIPAVSNVNQSKDNNNANKVLFDVLDEDDDVFEDDLINKTNMLFIGLAFGGDGVFVNPKFYRDANYYDKEFSTKDNENEYLMFNFKFNAMYGFETKLGNMEFGFGISPFSLASQQLTNFAKPKAYARTIMSFGGLAIKSFEESNLSRTLKIGTFPKKINYDDKYSLYLKYRTGGVVNFSESLSIVGMLKFSLNKMNIYIDNTNSLDVGRDTELDLFSYRVGGGLSLKYAFEELAILFLDFGIDWDISKFYKQKNDLNYTEVKDQKCLPMPYFDYQEEIEKVDDKNGKISPFRLFFDLTLQMLI